MAVSSTVQIIEQGPRNLVMQLTGIGDGAGNEEYVMKVDVSTLTPACKAVKIMKISGTVEYGVVELYWDALTPKKALELSGQIELSYRRVGGLTNNAGGGKNGDLLLTTIGFEANSTYNLLIEMVKK